MKSVLISINPKWCELIAQGKKTIEVRKTRLKIDTPFKCYVYCTQGYAPPDSQVFSRGMRGTVIGEFVCDKITDLRDMGGEEFFGTSCMTYTDWRNYTDYTKHVIYGWHISDLKIYDEPKNIMEFNKPCPSDFPCAICPYPELYDESFVCKYSVKRPPQSWMYVEEVGQ